MSQVIPCISIRQPWAWLIVRLDLTGEARAAAIAAGMLKDIENRTWATKYRGPVLIHAAKGMTRAEYDRAESFAYHEADIDIRPIPRFKDLQRGGIVGRARLVDCCIPFTENTSRWHMKEHFGFQLADVEPLPFTPLLGKLGLFRVEWPPAEVAA